MEVSRRRWLFQKTVLGWPFCPRLLISRIPGIGVATIPANYCSNDVCHPRCLCHFFWEGRTPKMYAVRLSRQTKLSISVNFCFSKTCIVSFSDSCCFHSFLLSYILASFINCDLWCHFSFFFKKTFCPYFMCSLNKLLFRFTHLLFSQYEYPIDSSRTGFSWIYVPFVL